MGAARGEICFSPLAILIWESLIFALGKPCVFVICYAENKVSVQLLRNGQTAEEQTTSTCCFSLICCKDP